MDRFRPSLTYRPAAVAACAPDEAERGEGEDGGLEGEGPLPADAVDEEEGEHRARELGERRPHQLHVVVSLQTAEIPGFRVK